MIAALIAHSLTQLWTCCQQAVAPGLSLKQKHVCLLLQYTRAKEPSAELEKHHISAMPLKLTRRRCTMLKSNRTQLLDLASSWGGETSRTPTYIRWFVFNVDFLVFGRLFRYLQIHCNAFQISTRIRKVQF
jgi:hypothetical protein